MKRAPTPSEIKFQMESHNTESKFFCRENMRGAGDTMKNFGTYRDLDGRVILYRKKFVKDGGRGMWVYDEQARTLRVQLEGDDIV